jgi:hypothetical protein
MRKVWWLEYRRRGSSEDWVRSPAVFYESQAQSQEEISSLNSLRLILEYRAVEWFLEANGRDV